MKPYEINAAVAASLSVSGEKVISVVVARLAAVEEEKRANALHKGVELAAKTHSKIRQLSKPAIRTYNEDGSVKDESYSQDQLKETKKLKEKLAKIERAVERATGVEPDWSELFNLKDEPDANSGKSEEAS